MGRDSFPRVLQTAAPGEQKANVGASKKITAFAGRANAAIISLYYMGNMKKKPARASLGAAAA
jgi:hypothetical protein